MSLIIRVIHYHFCSLVEEVHNNETEGISLLVRKCAFVWKRHLIQFARIALRWLQAFHNDHFDELGLFNHYLKSISYFMQFEDLKRKSLK
jgi:hypothetical protein